jgi:hypothetical protein
VHTIETLKELIEREFRSVRDEIIAERRIFEQRFRASDTALHISAGELSRRLDALNHAHELARQKEADFIGREAFNTFTARTSDDFAGLRKEIQATAGAVNTAKEQAAKALAESLSDAGKLGEARFARLEKSQSMMIGGLILVGAIIPVLVYILGRLVVIP